MIKLMSVRWPHICLALCLCAGLPGLAWAGEHALILWIGQYADPRVRIVGLEQDAALARNMAHALGVPAANIDERSNAQLTHTGLKQALASLRTRVRPGDGVFIYFSGHGRQLQRVSGGPGCSEGLATFEGGIYFDLLLRDELDALAQRASRVVMFNDSCFSGGAATKSFGEADVHEISPKTYPLGNATRLNAEEPSQVKSFLNSAANVPADASQACGVHANPVSKAFGGLAKNQRGVLYLAAAAANEAAYPTPQGSVGTRAWAACLQDPTTDSDKNGTLTGQELLTCANAWVQRNTRYSQTITLIGNGQMPLRRF
jgi:hypothetical protein